MAIDLHMHTVHSDGELSVQQLLKKAQDSGLKIISITDHSTMDAYDTLKQINIKEFFSGKVIHGVEIYSYYNGKVIEILAYGINIQKMGVFLKQTYGKEWEMLKRQMVIKKLMQISDELGLTYDKNFNFNDTNLGESATFFKHLKSFDENKKILGEDLWTGKLNFFRHAVNNKKSPFYVDYSIFYKTPKEIINFIHECGGKAFLAHTYYYGFNNVRKLLDHMKNCNIDGIECYYPLFTKRNCQFLLNYCKENNLLVSAGSDFHGSSRENKLGEVNKQIKINEKLLGWAYEI